MSSIRVHPYCSSCDFSPGLSSVNLAAALWNLWWRIFCLTWKKNTIVPFSTSTFPCGFHLILDLVAWCCPMSFYFVKSKKKILCIELLVTGCPQGFFLSLHSRFTSRTSGDTKLSLGLTQDCPCVCPPWLYCSGPGHAAQLFCPLLEKSGSSLQPHFSSEIQVYFQSLPVSNSVVWEKEPMIFLEDIVALESFWPVPGRIWLGVNQACC